MASTARSFAARAVTWLRLRRDRIPAPIEQFLLWARWRLPTSWLQALHPAGAAVRSEGRPTARPGVERRRVRVYIGPANYAGQGYLWRRALTTEFDDVAGVACACLDDLGRNFPADQRVPQRTYEIDRSWQRQQVEYVRSTFTHVLLEAGRPLFGSRYRRDPAAEIGALRRSGLHVALMAHGSEVRLPSAHAAREEWSPFRDAHPVDIQVLEQRSRLALELFRTFDGPVFVSTPDQLLDLPQGQWCPVVVEPDRWSNVSGPTRTHGRLRVLHAPSKSWVKGSAQIEPVVEQLHEAGVLQYRRVSGATASAMPATYASADVVLDQFLLGSYGVAACEAMASGRVVVGHVSDQVRGHVQASTGMDLPIVEATPTTLASVLQELADDPDRVHRLGGQGQEFVRVVHSGARSAEILGRWLRGGPTVL